MRWPPTALQLSGTCHSSRQPEELLEITHLAPVSYQLPDTGEIAPLLQIIPSKGNEELHDDTLKSEDRLPGLLLFLYAQWPAAISRLTVNHIKETDGAVYIRPGAVPVDLPVPVDDLALQQVEVRRSYAVLARTDSPWLFPGG
jgi:hypothetical protein